MKYFDAHCHIFNSDNLVPAMGVITNATQVADWESVLRMALSCQNIYGAIGIHPWFVSDLPDGWDLRLREHLILRPEIMVGEIGLDRHKSDFETQMMVFTRQLKIAVELNRGVHIHCIGAMDELLKVLGGFGNVLPPFILFHRYSGTTTDIPKLVEKYNAYFSYCHPNDKRVKATPIDRILSESDSDNPKHLISIADDLALILNSETETFVNNAKRMLKNG